VHALRTRRAAQVPCSEQHSKTGNAAEPPPTSWTLESGQDLAKREAVTVPSSELLSDWEF